MKGDKKHFQDKSNIDKVKDQIYGSMNDHLFKMSQWISHSSFHDSICLNCYVWLFLCELKITNQFQQKLSDAIGTPLNILEFIIIFQFIYKYPHTNIRQNANNCAIQRKFIFSVVPFFIYLCSIYVRFTVSKIGLYLMQKHLKLTFYGGKYIKSVLVYVSLEESIWFYACYCWYTVFSFIPLSNQPWHFIAFVRFILTL